MQAGERLDGRYRLDQRLGHGGMGEVWRGFDLSLDRPVAVKLLLDSTAQEQLVARFRREATIGARLQHPGITVVHDVGQHTDRLFIVMELLEGADLAALLRRRPDGLTTDEVVGFALQTAEALAAAHAQRIVHRDLKPANLFLLPNGRLKICDFGIARVADASMALTGTGWMGTPPYMAPEQWRGDPVDARCDLYALGCVIHELATGESPFGGDPHPMVVMRRHLDESPRALREIRPGVPAGLDRLVRRLLAKAVDDRPGSASEVVAELVALGPSGAALVPPAPRVPSATVRVRPGAGAHPPTVDASADDPAGELRAAVAGLLAEAEQAAQERASDSPTPYRGENLGRAAWAAARIDAPHASRLIGMAEHQLSRTWDGPDLATRLAELGASVRDFAPSHAARLLGEAQQLLFPLPRNDKSWQSTVGHVLRELASVDPERATRLAPSLTSAAARDRVYARAAASAAESDPRSAREYLDLIGDPARKAEVAFAARKREAAAAPDVDEVARIVEALPTSRDRAGVWCATVSTWAGLRRPEASGLLARAERSVRLAVRDRAGELRLAAAAAQQRSDLVEAARLQNLVESVLRDEDEEATGDRQVDALLRALAAARSQLSMGTVDDAQALSTARKRARGARLLTDPQERAAALIEVARTLVRPDWETLPEAPVPPPSAHSGPTVTAPARRASAGARQSPGTEAWRSDLAVPDSLAAAGDVVVWTAGDLAGGMSAQTGRTLWTAVDDQGVGVRPVEASRTLRSAVGPHAVYLAIGGVGRPGARVVARDAHSGRVLWWSDLADSVREERRNPLFIHDGMVLFQDRTALSALHPDTGRLVWTRPHTSGPADEVVTGQGRVVLMDRERMHGIDIASGEVRWSHARYTAGEIRSSAAPIHLWDGHRVRTLDAATGFLVWSHGPYGRAAPDAPPLLAADGRVFVAAHSEARKGDVVTALDAATGDVLWEHRAVRHTGDTCWLDVIGVHGDTVVVRAAWGGNGWLGGSKGKPFLMSLDIATGKPRWRWESERLGRRTALISGDHVLVPCPRYAAVALPADSRR
ncbi:protein kinase [Streptomyces hydrogenans]|uniref:serine/threonine-protein kinase n=1 Tax=Streptomyces hydrogenans TaxID=1873719 RepID=UPI0037FD350C